MTDPNIVRYMDEHYVKTGPLEVKEVRDYGEYTISVPVYNSSAEYAKNAVAVLHLDYTREGNDIVLHDIPEHLVSDDDCKVIKKAIADYLYEKELPTQTFREALLYRQQNPYNKQNDYYGWRKPDDTLFLVGLESHQINHILLYEYDTYLKCYNVKEYNIDPLTAHFRGPQQYDPLKELVAKVSKLEYLGAWTDPKALMDSKDGKIAACGRWELARAHLCSNFTNEPLEAKIAAASMRAAQEPSITDGAFRFENERS